MDHNIKQEKDRVEAVLRAESSEKEARRIRLNRTRELFAKTVSGNDPQPGSSDIPSAVVEQSLKADEERLKLDRPEDDKRRSAIQINFFPKDVNRGRLEFALEDLGFKVVVRGSKNLETNSIWYGSEVCRHMVDVQLVAYTLMRAGVQIKLVEQLENSAGRERTIIVGGNIKKETANVRALTVDDIGKLGSRPCVRPLPHRVPRAGSASTLSTSTTLRESRSIAAHSTPKAAPAYSQPPLPDRVVIRGLRIHVSPSCQQLFCGCQITNCSWRASEGCGQIHLSHLRLRERDDQIGEPGC